MPLLSYIGLDDVFWVDFERNLGPFFSHCQGYGILGLFRNRTTHRLLSFSAHCLMSRGLRSGSN